MEVYMSDEERAMSSEDKLRKVTEIISGVARKYGSIYVNSEDLENDLWVHILTISKRYGGIENMPLKLIAKSCFRKAVDSYRYNRRRKDSTATLYEDSGDVLREEGELSAKDIGNSTVDAFGGTPKSKFDSGYERLVIKDAIDLFPKESRSRKYILSKLYIYGELDNESELLKEDFPKFQKEPTEKEILKELGLNSYSGSWVTEKHLIYEKICEYIGVLPEAISRDSDDFLIAINSYISYVVNKSSKNYISFKKLKKDSVIRVLGVSDEEVLEVVNNNPHLFTVKKSDDMKSWYIVSKSSLKEFEEDGYKLV